MNTYEKELAKTKKNDQELKCGFEIFAIVGSIYAVPLKNDKISLQEQLDKLLKKLEMLY